MQKVSQAAAAVALSEKSCRGRSGKLKLLECHILLSWDSPAGGMELCGSIKTTVFGGEMCKSLLLLQWQTNFIPSIF